MRSLYVAGLSIRRKWRWILLFVFLIQFLLQREFTSQVLQVEDVKEEILRLENDWKEKERIYNDTIIQLQKTKSEFPTIQPKEIEIKNLTFKERTKRECRSLNRFGVNALIMNEKEKGSKIRRELKNLLEPDQRRQLNRLLGKNWHGGLLASNHQSKRREYSPSSQENTQDRKLVAAFIPIPLYKENLRNVLRLIHQIEHQKDVTFFFTVGKAKNETERKLIDAEREAFGDLLEVPIEEGMNNGKTYQSFKLMYNLFVNSSSRIRYDFFMKLDDDTFIYDLYPRELNKVQRRNRSFIGIRETKPVMFMLGRCYTVSEDLLEYIATDPWVAENNDGIEDLMTGSWMRRPEAGTNWINWGSTDMRDKYKQDKRVYTNLFQKVKITHEVKSVKKYYDIFNRFALGRNREFQMFFGSSQLDRRDKPVVDSLCSREYR